MTEPDKSKYSFSEADKKYMKLAIKLAEKAAGNTGPNPMVGAVIVRDGKIISTGFHKKAGDPHAEIEAINACRDASLLEGSTMYATLEPCSIFGRTTPCTDALIRHRFAEVIIGSVDPNPAINGRGLQLLRKAGIRTRAGLFGGIVARQNEIFFKSISNKMPFVALKVASSIDGKTALKNKKSKWITSGPSREKVQDIRYRHDCVLTGISTVIADDPLLFPRNSQYLKNNLSLVADFAFDLDGNLKIKPNIGPTVKTPPLTGKKFYRVILDSGLGISRDSNIVKTAYAVKTIIFTRADKSVDADKAGYLERAGIDILKVSGEESFNDTGDISGKGQRRFYLDLKEVLGILYTVYGITSVLVESGPTLLAEFLKNKLADKFYFFIAPKIIGGDSPFNMFSGLGITDMADMVKLDFDKIRRVGADIFITAYPKGTDK